MDKPTKEQIKEFWEWCGLKWFWNHNPNCTCGAKDDDDSERSWCYHKNGEWELATRFRNEPMTINLTNLFKYPIPKLTQKYIELEIHFDYLAKSDSWNVALLDGFYDKSESNYLIAVKNDKDPAQGLFWAIWEVIHNG